MIYKIPIQILEIESNNFHILIDCKFVDKSGGKWVIDTGASKTVFDKNLNGFYEIDEMETDEIHSAGIQQIPIKTSIAHLKPVVFKKFKLNTLKVALLDLTHINELYAASSQIKICGLLGGDFLNKYKAVIDYKRSRIVLSV